MAYPADLKYTKEHEWIRVEGDTGAIGITDFAQQQLGDVVYVELPEVGSTITAGQVFGTIESVKAVSELFAPVTGEVVETNGDLKDRPDQVNSKPTDTWMVTVRLASPDEAASLLAAMQNLPESFKPKQPLNTSLTGLPIAHDRMAGRREVAPPLQGGTR